MSVAGASERGVRTRRRILPAGSTWRSPLAIVGMTIAGAWIVIAIAAPLLAPSDPLAQDYPPQKAPSWQHLFGTDELGRDVLSRVMYGARLSLPVALLLVGLALLDRRHARGDRRLLRRVLRRPDHALDRSRVRVPGDHPGDGRHRGARPEPRQRGVRAGDRELALVRARRARSRALAGGLRLRLGDASARLVGRAAPWCATCCRTCSVRCAVLATLDLGNAILLLSGLSFLGLGSQPPDAGVGRRRGRGDPVLPGLVDRRVPGLRDLHGRARVQPARRQPARRARPDVVAAARGRRWHERPPRGRSPQRAPAHGERLGHDRRRRQLRRRAGPGLRRRRRERQRQDDLGARAHAAAARRSRRSEGTRGSAAAIFWRCAGARCAACAAARSRWSSRIP